MSELRQAKLIRQLTDEQWERFKLAMKRYEKSYSKGQIIYLEGETCKTMDFITSGTLFVKRHDAEGRTLMVERFTFGDFLGANLLFASDHHYPMTIMAETDCKLVSFERADILNWCQKNGDFLAGYLQEISDKTQVLVRTINKLSTGTLREKLMQDFHREKNEKNVVTLKVTKKELSERYGVARTSLSRELNRMVQDGLIEMLGRNKIKINP